MAKNSRVTAVSGPGVARKVLRFVPGVSVFRRNPNPDGDSCTNAIRAGFSRMDCCTSATGYGILSTSDLRPVCARIPKTRKDNDLEDPSIRSGSGWGWKGSCGLQVSRALGRPGVQKRKVEAWGGGEIPRSHGWKPPTRRVGQLWPARVCLLKDKDVIHFLLAKPEGKSEP